MFLIPDIDRIPHVPSPSHTVSAFRFKNEKAIVDCRKQGVSAPNPNTRTKMSYLQELVLSKKSFQVYTGFEISFFMAGHVWLGNVSVRQHFVSVEPTLRQVFSAAPPNCRQSILIPVLPIIQHGSCEFPEICW